MALHVHRAARSDGLVAALADVFATPLPDPLETEVIGVHSRGIERWISQELSGWLGTGPLGSDGVCANVSFPFPGRLVRGAIAAATGIEPGEDPWLSERLLWPLLEIADADPTAEELGPLRHHLAGKDSGDDQDGTAQRIGALRHVADLFDRYGVHRPEMVQAWSEGQQVGPDGEPLPEQHGWQFVLWRTLRERLGVPSFAERHSAATATLRGTPDLVDLPSRFALFGLTSLPASYLEVLVALAEHRDVHMMLLHPSPTLWDRVADTMDRGAGQQLFLRDDDPTAELPRNSLLGSWGRDARELQLVAPAPDDPAFEHDHSTSRREPSTLLERLQHAVIRDQALPVGGEPSVLDPDDQSVQVHDCHGRLRQVEVVREAILHLLAEKEDLEPRDVIVMCPDIETFAPLVTAVFGAAAVVEVPDDEDGPPALRVQLADRSVRTTNPVLEVVAALFELVDGRITASQVLDLVSRAPVRRRFGFDEDELDLIESWVADLQIRWGLDGAHRQQHGMPELDANTWRAGLRRLQLGATMADEDLRLVDGIVPYDGVEGRDTDLAGRLVELVERLERVTAAMRSSQTVSEWRETIADAADALTLPAPDAVWQRLQLQRVIDDLVEQSGADDAPSTVELSIADVRALLDDRLAGRPTTTGHRTGALTVCTLVPMRSVPHRVVCVLGLDDGAFPRQTVTDSDDLLLDAPRVGDRDPRSEDRQLLLDALLSASETFVVTHAGRNVRTNEDRPPAVPVEELLDAVDRTATTGDGSPARQRITVRHPLAAHDPRNFETRSRTGAPAPWGFDPAELGAAYAKQQPASPTRPFVQDELPSATTEVVELDDLIDFLQHPVRGFFRQRLEVSLSTEDDEPSDTLPVRLRGLDAWRVGDELISSWLGGAELARAEQVARRRGLVPPGEVAPDDLDEVRGTVERIIELCGHLEIHPGRRTSIDIEVALPDGRTLTGAIPGIGSTPRIDSINYSKVKAKHRLAAWARFLAASAHDPAGGWEAVTVGRHAWQSRVHAARLPALSGDPETVHTTAITHLERLLDLYDRGMRAPIPLYCDTSAKIATNLDQDKDPEKYVNKEWETARYLGWKREDLDPYHVLALGGQRRTAELFAEICRDDEADWHSDGRRVVAYAWRLWEPIMTAERDVTR